MKLKIIVVAILVIAGLFFANKYLNKPTSTSTPSVAKGEQPAGGVRNEFTVGHLPVTCHLTCPVTSWTTKHSTAGTLFQSQRYGDFASMKEAFIARKLDAGFFNAPTAMKLVSDGIPCHIVYLGHRDGSAIIVPADSDYKTFADLKGKKVAIPGRFSNQNILMRKKMKELGMAPDDITLVELPPPEHPTALASKAIDAYIIGEPHAAKAEMAGTGRVLYQVKDLWPNFISCVLVVRDELIAEKPELVTELVHGIAASGEWLDEDKDAGAQHRKDAAVVVGKMFYNQDPKLLEFVLTRPLDRVSYTNLLPPKKDFDEIMAMALEVGVLTKHLNFEDYVDTSFAPDLETVDLPFDRLPMPTEAELASAK